MIAAVMNYVWRAVLAGLLLAGVALLSLILLARLGDYSGMPAAETDLLVRIVVSKLLVAAALTYPALRSRWRGTQLMCAVFVAYFGVYSFLPHSEAFVALSSDVMAATAALLMAHGFLMALVFSGFVVAITGRLWSDSVTGESARLHMPTGQWLWRLGACLSVRLVLKLGGARWFSAGAFGAGPESAGVGLPLWWFIQAGHALLLVVFALPLIKMMKGGRLEAALTVACVLGVLGGLAPVLSAGPFFPGTIQVGGAAEMTISNFLYGALVGYLFSYSEPKAAVPGAFPS